MKFTSITATYHRSYNYGASLQSYALQQSLLEYGFGNKVLDFESKNSYLPKFTTNPRIMIGRIVYFICALIHYKELNRQKKGFDAFTKKIRTTEKYHSMRELANNPPEAHFYISGSDQIFDLRENDFTVFRNMLLYVDDSKPKFSFAASLAHYDLNEKEKSTFKKILSNYKMVSLREKSAKKVFQSYINNSFFVHLDPVFLIPQKKWQEIAILPDTDEDYLLYFQVNSNNVAQSIINKIQKENSCTTVCVQTNPYVRVRVDRVIMDASPEEFLGWILRAKKIITTSFHGTAFSIIFHKDFYTITKDNSNPIRIKELLHRFGLEDRLITSAEAINGNACINYDNIDSIIDKNKKDVQSYFSQIKSVLDETYKEN